MDASRHPHGEDDRSPRSDSRVGPVTLADADANAEEAWLERRDRRLATSVRSVTRMTAAQLHRKRALDRQNQRDTRARRTALIASLEREKSSLKDEVAQLESQLASATRPIAPAIRPRPWSVLPLHVAPTCRLDHVVTSIINNSEERPQTLQALLAETAQKSFPSVVSLLDSASTASAPLSSVIGEHGSGMQITSSAARTALLHNLCLYVRWLWAPTEQNYMALPSYLRPLPLQLLTPHPIWIDAIPWPQAREQLITHLDWTTEFESFRRIHNTTLSVNWPLDLADIIIARPESGEIALNPEFEQHVRDVRNWTIGPEVLDRFPYLDCIPRKTPDFSSAE